MYGEPAFCFRNRRKFRISEPLVGGVPIRTYFGIFGVYAHWRA